MLLNRVIPILLLDRGALVKTVNFKNPRYLGDPINTVRIFNEKEVDELVLLDIGAQAVDDGPDIGLVEKIASECFMPLAYGGHIRGWQDAERLFAAGVEKVVLRTAAARDLQSISEISRNVGTQAVAVAIDLKRGRTRKQRLVVPGTGRHGDTDWTVYAREVVAAGAGEIVLTCVDREGTMQGMDLDVIKSAAAAVDTPIIAHGGVGSMDHISAGLRAGATAVGVGSFVVYQGSRRAVLLSYPSKQELEQLQGGCA